MLKNTALRAEDSKRQKMFHIGIRYEKIDGCCVTFQMPLSDQECSGKGGMFLC